MSRSKIGRLTFKYLHKSILIDITMNLAIKINFSTCGQVNSLRFACPRSRDDNSGRQGLMWRHLSDNVRPPGHVRLHHVHVLIIPLSGLQDVNLGLEAGQETRHAPVCLHVCAHVVLPGEALTAQSTLVRLHTCVDLLMIFQLIFLGERFFTLATLVVIFPSVPLLVDYEVRVSLECFVTV